MNAINNTNTGAVQLNETFLRLVSGAATMRDIITERANSRAAMLAREDAIARSRREWAEAREQFFSALAY